MGPSLKILLNNPLKRPSDPPLAFQVEPTIATEKQATDWFRQDDPKVTLRHIDGIGWAGRSDSHAVHGE